jgi:hypothetical protein
VYCGQHVRQCIAERALAMPATDFGKQRRARARKAASFEVQFRVTGAKPRAPIERDLHRPRVRSNGLRSVHVEVLHVVDLDNPRLVPALTQNQIDGTPFTRRHCFREVQARQLGVQTLDERPTPAALLAPRPIEPYG